MTSASDILKEHNAALHTTLVSRIHEAPDPRPVVTAKAFGEKWTTDLAWSRILHELEVLSQPSLAEDAKLFEEIQEGLLGERSELRSILLRWKDEYPLLWWTLEVSKHIEMRYIRVALGDTKGIVAKDVTKKLLDYIRDLFTAKALRKIKPKVGAPRGAMSLSDAIKEHRVGQIYWLLSVYEPSDPTDDEWNAIAYAIVHHDDEEALIPFVEQGTLDMSFRVMRSEDMKGSPNIFPTFIVYTAKKYVDDILSGAISSEEALGRLMRCFWNFSNTNNYIIDASLGLRIVQEFMRLPKDALTGEVLVWFTSPEHDAIWRLVLDKLPLNVYDIQPMAIITCVAHDVRKMDHLAEEYAAKFIEVFERNPNYRDVFSYADVVDLYYLYIRLPKNAKEFLLDAWSGVFSLEHLRDILREETDKESRHKILRKQYAQMKKFTKARKIPYYEMLADALNSDETTFAFRKLGKNFLRVVPADKITADIWDYITLEDTARMAMEKIGPPPIARVVDMLHARVDAVFALPPLLVQEAMKYVSIVKNTNPKYVMRLASYTQTPFNDIYSHNTLEDILTKTSTTDTFEYVHTIPVDSSPIRWSAILLHFLKLLHSHTKYLTLDTWYKQWMKDVVIYLIERGADPSYKSFEGLLLIARDVHRPYALHILPILLTRKVRANINQSTLQSILGELEQHKILAENKTK